MGQAPLLKPQKPLPGGRERCFGKYFPEDWYCQGCPGWVLLACQAQTPGFEHKFQNEALIALHKQLDG